MQPVPQPFVRAQQPLATHWQAWQAAPQLRLSRWLTTEADRPLLHDYLLGLTTDPTAPLQRVSPSPSHAWAASLTSPADAPTIWLDPLPLDAEQQLRPLLASRHPPRLLVLEDRTTQPLQRLARWLPSVVHTCTPAVSMQQLLAEIRQIPTTAEEPASRFQQQFHQLSEAIARADSPAVAAAAAACQAAATALPSAGAAVSVGLAAGHYFLAQKQADKAVGYFAAARASAEAAYATGDSSAGLLSVQAWLGEAAVWQQCRRRPEALVALRQAMTRAAQLPASLLSVEAARQLGLALDQDGQARPALASYQQGLHFAEQLPSDQRSAAVIQALGDAYSKCLRTTTERQELHTRLVPLLT